MFAIYVYLFEDMLKINIRPSKESGSTMTPAVNDIVVRMLGRERLEIQMSDSTSDSPKSSDRFDNHDAKIRNRKTCLETGSTVSSVVLHGRWC